MQIDGYALREAIKQWELRKSAAEEAFKTSLYKFKGEEKDTPQQVVDSFLKAETAISKLQVAQMHYNLAVTVTVGNERMSLAEAIKRVGGAGRAEKMWRSAGPKDRRNPYLVDDELTRDPTRERATPTLDPKTLVELAMQAGKRSGAFRAAIATANAVKIDVVSLDPALFE